MAISSTLGQSPTKNGISMPLLWALIALFILAMLAVGYGLNMKEPQLSNGISTGLNNANRNPEGGVKTPTAPAPQKTY